MSLFVWLQNITQVFNQFGQSGFFAPCAVVVAALTSFEHFFCLVNPVGLEAISWKYYFLFWSILIVLLIIIVWKFPETK